MKKLSVYIHIPFCARRCGYCNFVTFVDRDNYMYDYTDCLIKEMKMQAKKFKDYAVQSVYIGGGTPSYLHSGLMLKIMKALRENYTFLKNVEITIEANPNSLSIEKLEEYKACGINRLSIGAQTCNNHILKNIDRLHNFNDFKLALELAQAKGFDNISVDMLLGLPKQTKHDVIKMLKYLVAHEVKHISAYSLILEHGTPMFNKVSSGKMILPSEDKTVEMYNAVYKYLTKKGFKRYEVSNFAIPDYECLHNTVYWTMGEYIGFGVAAHSYAFGERFANTNNLDEYIDTINSKKLAVVDREVLSIEEQKEETIMLSLRTSKGINIEAFNNKFNCNILEDKQKEIAFLMTNRFIVIERGFLKLADNAFYVLNSVVQKLI